MKIRTRIKKETAKYEATVKWLTTDRGYSEKEAAGMITGEIQLKIFVLEEVLKNIETNGQPKECVNGTGIVHEMGCIEKAKKRYSI